MTEHAIRYTSEAPKGPRPGFALSRCWTSTSEIADAMDWQRKPTRRILKRLEAAGLVEVTRRADGAELWRSAERGGRR